jgi:Peptidase family M23
MRRLICALVAVAAAAVPAAVARGAGDATAVISPVGMYVAHDPIPVLGGDGRMHLAYEIKVANQTDLEVTLESLQATANGKPIGRLYAPTVLATVMRIDGDGTGTTVGPGQGATLFMDVAYPVKRKTPPKLRHQVNLSFRPEGSSDPPTTQAYTGVKVAVNDSEPLNVEPPLRGERWLIGNGCCDKITAHRGATLAINGTIDAPERFAIDFVQLTAADALVDGPYGDLASWPFFGDKIRAATDGKVVKIQDGLPEQTPGVFPTDPTVQTAGGNFMVIRIDAGHYAFYAHMQPGSMRFKVGDRVRTGQVLGLLGNTGNTDGPHLHFHIMDGASPLQSNGLPFTFTRWRGQGVVTNEVPLVAGQSAPVDPGALAGKRRAALPLNDQLVKFR